MVNGPDKAAFMQRLGVDAVVDSSVAGQQVHKAIKAVAPKGERLRGVAERSKVVFPDILLASIALRRSSQGVHCPHA